MAWAICRKDVTALIEISLSCFRGRARPTGISQGLGPCRWERACPRKAGPANTTLDSASIKPFIAIIRRPQIANSPHASPADSFFDRDAQTLAKALLVGHPPSPGRPVAGGAHHRNRGLHHRQRQPCSLGYTEKRKALFLDGGHIYMYARGGDSLNFSAHGPGNAVLIKSAYPAGTPARPQQPGPDATEQPRCQWQAAPAGTPVRRANAAVPRPGLESATVGRPALRRRAPVCGGLWQPVPKVIQATRLASARARRAPAVPLRRCRVRAFLHAEPLAPRQVEGRDFFILEQGS